MADYGCHVDTCEAFILRSRPYGETSLLLDCFTQDFGYIRLLAKGWRRNIARGKSFCEPFTPLVCGWRGRSELKTVTQLDPINEGYWRLSGHYLFSGFYLNELLLRFLPRWDPYVELYQCYRSTVFDMAQGCNLEISLRRFEKVLLAEMGYGLTLTREYVTGKLIVPDIDYVFSPQQGLVTFEKNMIVDRKFLFRGLDLLAIAADDWSRSEVIAVAKRLMRLALAPYLGSKPLQSRKLFQFSRM